MLENYAKSSFFFNFILGQFCHYYMLRFMAPEIVK